MFGSLGFPELILIFIVALIVFGPKRLPEIGRTLGKALGEFKKATDDLKNTIEREVQVEELKQLASTTHTRPTRPYQGLSQAPRRSPMSRRSVPRPHSELTFRRRRRIADDRHRTGLAGFDDAPRVPTHELPKMTFLDHLEELRKRLIVSIVAIGVMFLALLELRRQNLRLGRGAVDEVPSAGRQARLHPPDRAVHALHEGGVLRRRSSSPRRSSCWQVWLFISPGLYKRERR